MQGPSALQRRPAPWHACSTAAAGMQARILTGGAAAAGMHATDLGGPFWELFEPAEMSQHAIEAQGNKDAASLTGFTATLRRGSVTHTALFRRCPLDPRPCTPEVMQGQALCARGRHPWRADPSSGEGVSGGLVTGLLQGVVAELSWASVLSAQQLLHPVGPPRLAGSLTA